MAKVFLTLWFAVGYLMLSYTIQAQHNSDSTSSSSGSSPSSESDSSSSTSSRQSTNSGGARKKTNITPRQTTPTVMNQPPQDQGPTMQFNEGLSKETLVLHCNQRNILASGNKKILIARLVAWQQGQQQQQQQQSPTQPNIGEPIEQDLPRNTPGDVIRPNKHTRTRKRRSKAGKSRHNHVTAEVSHEGRRSLYAAILPNNTNITAHAPTRPPNVTAAEANTNLTRASKLFFPRWTQELWRRLKRVST